MSAVGSILSNDGALKALNSLRTSSNQTNTLETQLSSGKKINSPADNPAGYITVQGFTSQLNGINQATSNANQAVSLLQTAQGAINQQTNIVQKMNSIAVQAANGTQTPSEAQSLQNVVGQLNSQVNTIANQTQFNNINLLNGSFTGVDFQVGANNGQTISLSIGSTKATSLGMYASQGSSGVYTPSSAQGVLTKGKGKGAFTTGKFTINGSNGSARVKVNSKTESAKTIANAINQTTTSTNVQAQARNQFTLSASGGPFNFKLGNGSGGSSNITNSASINATNKSNLVSAINGATSTTGISAKSVGSGNKIQLTQHSGKNISITNVTSGKLSTVNRKTNVTLSSGGPSNATIQGKVQLQSDKSFSLGSSASKIGLAQSSNPDYLSNINVSTTQGAQKAINVIKYALESLGAQGGQLGAVQQRLQANINNLHTTSQNLSSAKSVVQDANIPKVAQQLTQQQVLQQAGISALKNSTSLQKQYQRILP